MNKNQKQSVWRVEPSARPTEGHAADAVEYAEGEPVRRVTLPRLDCEILQAHADIRKDKERDPYIQEIAARTSIPVPGIEACLNRLDLIGLITLNPNRQTLQ